MTTAAPTSPVPYSPATSPRPDSLSRRVLSSPRVLIGGSLLLIIALACILTLPWTLSESSRLYFDAQGITKPRQAPSSASLPLFFGSDELGRSILSRCLLGGTISLFIGLCAAAISVLLGLTVGLLAGFRGGWVDHLLMRSVDILYGLPYILLIILFKVAFEKPLTQLLGTAQAANLVVMFAAIGLVSWLTMARVVRGQVLSLRAQPFVEAARAIGVPPLRIFFRHILPNLVGPVTVYATLIIPQAILQESFLSFLGVGVNPPLPTWGSLASTSLSYALSPIRSLWWMLFFPALLLVVTLLALNFLGDGLRDIFDPKREAAKL
jgi:ABC-type dipeptide/oligopeptide/nickel transport system permease subunit